MKLSVLAIFLLVILSTHHQLSATPTQDLRDPYGFMTANAKKALSGSYDYIIVGGGTAGCPLAATLSTKYSVLVLERGGSPYGNLDVQNATLYGKALREANNYTSIAQSFVSEDGVQLARARVLGGGTAINSGLYSRASSEDIRSMGLDGELVHQSYEWVEKMMAFEPKPLSVWSTTFRNALVEAGVLPYNGYTLDHMEGTKIAASTFDNEGRRHTAADLLKKANPRNIVVLLNATVSRVLFHSESGKLKAYGVEFTNTVDGRSHQVLTKPSSQSGEVILSAGSLGSTQLLLLSGIGPSQQLKQLGIPVLLDFPSVGKRIQDNPALFVATQSPTPLPVTNLQIAGVIYNSENYFESGIQEQVSNGKTVNLGFILEKLGYPLSKGELRLRSRDPRDNPSVRYNYYSDPVDLQRCVQGARVMAKVLLTKAFKPYAFTGNTSGFVTNTSDDAVVAQLCKTSLGTIYHFHGGCNKGHVIDKDYRVKGVDGLRIVDGSTFEISPGTNPQATLMMLGRYIGMKLLGERRAV